jgi:hypothetical protein
LQEQPAASLAAEAKTFDQHRIPGKIQIPGFFLLLFKSLCVQIIQFIYFLSTGNLLPLHRVSHFLPEKRGQLLQRWYARSGRWGGGISEIATMAGLPARQEKHNNSGFCNNCTVLAKKLKNIQVFIGIIEACKMKSRNL